LDSDLELVRRVWAFLLGLDLEELQARVSEKPDARWQFGGELYDAILRTHYPGRDGVFQSDDPDVLALKRRLREWARSSGCCPCSIWDQYHVVPLGSETTDLLGNDFNVLKSRNPWLDLVACRICGQPWYVATDTVDDNYHFWRLAPPQVRDIELHGRWPSRFDEFENVWPDSKVPGEGSDVK